MPVECESDALVQPLINSGADVLRAEGAADVWEFRLQFKNRAWVVTFTEGCQENDVQMQLNVLYNPAVPVKQMENELTDEQYNIIDTTYQQGYWEIPRQITLGELAGLIGISSNTASQRLRRGLITLVGAALRSE